MAEYIDKQAFLDRMKRTSRYFNVKFDIESFPAADVAPVVHGRKIEDGDIGCFWLCSLCGECLPYGANYCPHCGAKMDGGENDEAN